MHCIKFEIQIQIIGERIRGNQKQHREGKKLISLRSFQNMVEKKL